MSNTCCVRNPVAKLLALYDEEGKVAEIRNVSEWNEQLFSMTEFRYVQWVLFLNGLAIHETGFAKAMHRQRFIGAVNNSNGYALFLPNGRGGVVSWIKKIAVNDNDKLEVAIFVKNGDGNLSKRSNKVLLNINNTQECCPSSYVAVIGGQQFCLVTKLDNQSYCVVHNPIA